MLQRHSMKQPLLLFTRTLSSGPHIAIRDISTEPAIRRFSSGPAAATTVNSIIPLLSELFSRCDLRPEDVRSKIDSLNLTFTPNTINSILGNLNSNPDTAYNFFNWLVAETEKEDQSERPNSKCFNSMLEILGRNGFTDRFWGLAAVMRKKGYCIAKETYLSALAGFDEEGLMENFEKLKEIYSHENLVVWTCLVIYRVLRSESGESDIFKKLDELGIGSVLSSDLVISVLDRISQFPNKAILFFHWVETQTKPNFKIDGRVYNSMARVVGREDCLDEFWSVLNKMRDRGFELERETYMKVVERFLKRKMVSTAVDLFQFNPSSRDLTFLLKKIAVSTDLDVNLELVPKIVGSYLHRGNSINGSSVFEGILKSLRSVGRLGESDKFLNAMEEGGFKPDSFVHSKVIAGLSEAHKLEQALNYINEIEESGYSLDLAVWADLIQNCCLHGNTDLGLSCYNKMLEQKGNSGFPVDVLINGFCKNKETLQGYNVLKDILENNKNVRPRHKTYKTLIKKLIGERKVKEALNLLPLMKGNGYPPYIDPFVVYIGKTGCTEQAVDLLKAMSCKRFPSRRVYLRLFEALFKQGRHGVAQDLLAKSPGSVRNHEDVLDLFYNMKLEREGKEVEKDCLS